MSIINRVPKGFLGLLDAKSQGRTPEEPVGALSPTLDLKENYLADIPLGTAVATSPAPAALTNTAILEVPAGVIWYVYGVSSECTQVLAGEWSIPACAIAGPDTVVPTIFYHSTHTSNVGIGGVLGLANIGASMEFFSSPFIATPGTRFSTFIIDQGPNGTGGASFTRTLFRSVVT